jgi:hypothetical protein
VPGSAKDVRTVRVTDVRASFARNYRTKGGLAKSADAQRQAFTRALKAALAEGMVNQNSWDGADWLFVGRMIHFRNPRVADVIIFVRLDPGHVD